MYKKIQITRFDLRTGESKLEDRIIVESVLRIFINGSHFSSLVCTPSFVEELAVGNLFSEGFIEDSEEISSVRKSEEGTSVFVDLKKATDHSFADNEFIITSGCGRSSTASFDFEGEIKKNQTPGDVNPIFILSLFREFHEKSVLFSQTGGVHSAALCDENGIISFMDDIGRHNAVDKIIGRSLLQGEKGENKFLIFSGRISSEIFLKAHRFGVYMIASRSAPTDRSVDMAKASNIRLIGFARGQTLNLYN
ncbi:formate dehydrogenase accessory sulfurtransferase FdhD [candidate division WOR-3 bacterium]|nr:formate dehydrogenase accessory sulfurtransferase FdhD [candidate division WOR-3 bacterium]